MNDKPSLFIAVCPNCLLSLRVNYEYSGRLVRCRHCDEAFRPFSPDFGAASGSAEYAVGPIVQPKDRPDLIVTCPSCATTLSVRARYAGRHVRCGACRYKFRVEADAAIRENPDDPGGSRVIDPADGPDARTPDPDFEPGEVARLIQEVAALRKRNERLLGRHDELRIDVERLEARIQQLEIDRVAADLRGAELGERVARSARRRALVGPVAGQGSDHDHDHDHDEIPTTFPFLPDRSAVSSR